MSLNNRFSNKTPYEIVPLSFGFANLLKVGETINAGPVVDVFVENDIVDATPDAILSGAAQVQGSDVLQLVQGGVVNADYAINVRVITSLNNKYEIEFTLPVRNK